MLAYWVKDIAPEHAKGHPRLARLLPAAPWAYKAHPAGGTLIYWQKGEKLPALSEFGEPRECADGLAYYPPLVLPALADLAKSAAGRPDVAWVPLACGQSAAILPAYLEPRRVLSNGTEGDPVTAYGLTARDADALFKAAPGKVSLLHPTLLKLCRLALSLSYRLTDELIDDLGILTTGDIDPIIDASFYGPKAEPASAP